ncbi:hypothetical protein [Eggerthella sinensis]|uniref:hypothetical protein n=1 Tax=Eggerthella sinensis TaxID=242230 RepID=UPI0022E61280|nr:hypothetical protein [Eggerthella sinensis]
MGLGLFYYTLIVLLAVILTAATCLASFLVTRNRTYACAFAGFLFYFFDVALVFQDDFLMQRAAELSSTPFFIGSPVASIVIGGGTLVSFWLVICEYLKEQRRAMRLVPGAASWRAASRCSCSWRPAACRCFCSTACESCCCTGCSSTSPSTTSAPATT